jgi:hypothetical protein
MQVLPTQLPLQRRLLVIINTMQLKNTLGRVDTNARKLPHGRFPCLRISNDLNLAHSMPSGPSTPTFSFPSRGILLKAERPILIDIKLFAAAASIVKMLWSTSNAAKFERIH